MDHGIYLATALLISLLWGLSPICFKYALSKGLDPPLVLCVSSAVYFSCMLAFAFANWPAIRANAAASLTWETFAVLGIASVLTAFVANLLFLHVLANHSSYITTALVYSSPIFTVLVAWLVLREEVTVYGCLGVFFVVLGVLFVALEESQRTPHGVEG